MIKNNNQTIKLTLGQTEMTTVSKKLFLSFQTSLIDELNSDWHCVAKYPNWATP